MSKRRWPLCALLCLLLLQTGCWNRVELNDIAIISATGVDWRDGKWVLSYQIVIPRAISSQTVGNGAAAVNVFSTEGDNFRSAINKASEETSRRLYFSHNQIVIIGQDAARKGMSSLLEAYLRNHDSRETVGVFLSRDDARTMLEQLIPLEQIPGAAIQRMVANEDQGSSSFRQMTIHSVLTDLLGSTKATSIPGLIISGSGESTDSVKMIGKTSTPSKVRLHQLGLVRGDKLVGWLSDEQSLGVMWLTDHVGKTTVSFDCTDGGKGKKSSAARIMQSNTKVRPVLQDGHWVMEVKVDAEGTLVEYSCDSDLTKPKVVSAAEKRIASAIRTDIMNGWNAVRKHNADMLGFGTLIHEHYPKRWKQDKENWDVLFPQTEVRLTVHMKLSSTGMSGKNFKGSQKKSGSSP
ncbi:Ger(x)C family spore germination protein [Paenibacillus sp. GCM10027627]|uniref:Ger(x)C family spore germination protein n=1 Tax=unclassified Paenibacillus TaxID=185978 RepID=UPI003633F71A